MKKIFLLFVAISISACSSSDDSSTEIGGIIKFRINGVQREFNDVEVSQTLAFEGTPDEYTELYVVGYNDQLPAEHFRFQIFKGETEDFAAVVYFNGSNEFFRQPTAFTFNTTTNNDSQKLKGTFSGTVQDSEGNEKSITQGEFNIQY